MDCERGNPVSALGVGGNGLWKKNNFSPHLEVAFTPCVSGDLHEEKNEKNSRYISIWSTVVIEKDITFYPPKFEYKKITVRDISFQIVYSCRDYSSCVDIFANICLLCTTVNFPFTVQIITSIVWLICLCFCCRWMTTSFHM